MRFREDLKNWALRKLGAPALQINVTPEQIEDRIDEALDTYWHWHYDGHNRDYVMHVLTQNNITTRTIDIDPWIYTIIRIIRIGGVDSSMNLEYQSLMQNIGTQILVRGEGLVNYTVALSYLGIVDDYFRREKILDFHFNKGKLYIHSDLTGYNVGDVIVFEAYRFCKPEEAPIIWADMWLRKYASALIKKQWGQNMSKYVGFQLPSGISLNGDAIYQDALREIQELEEVLQSRESLPPDFMIG